MSTPNLLLLTDLASALLAQVEFVAELSDGEVPDELVRLLEAAEADRDAKLEAVAALRENFLACANARKDQAEKILAEAKKDVSTADRLLEWAQYCMASNGLEKVTAGRFRFAIKGNGGKAPLIISDTITADSVPDAFVRTKRELDKDAIRATLEAGVELEWAKIGERGKRLEIK